MADLLPIGSRAPDFTLQGTGGQTVRSADFQGQKHLVLVFYVKDSTPG